MSDRQCRCLHDKTLVHIPRHQRNYTVKRLIVLQNLDHYCSGKFFKQS